jgi:dienelactone hydrolase
MMPTAPSLATAAAIAGPCPERVLRAGDDGGLVAIATDPAPGHPPGPTFVFVSAGLVHRVGPNRMYAHLARRLAARGSAAVRLDLSGIGDSEARGDGLPADEAYLADIRAIMDAMEDRGAGRRFVLAGLCSGAVHSFRTALADDRVVGAVLLNPQQFDHDPAWNAGVEARTEARRYMTRAVRGADNWKRALTGKIDYRRAVRVLSRRLAPAVAPAPAVSAISARLAGDFASLAARGVRLLVVCCAGDSSEDYMTEIMGADVLRAPATPALAVEVFARTDHSFTLAASQARLADLVDAWAGSLA